MKSVEKWAALGYRRVPRVRALPFLLLFALIFLPGELHAQAGAGSAPAPVTAPAPTGTAAPVAPSTLAEPEPEEADAPRAVVPPSEAELAEGMPILSIDVAGNRRVTADDVRTYLKERVGSP